MPVLLKSHHASLLASLRSRYATLADSMISRELTTAREGCVRGSWISPQQMCATLADSVSLRLALADFEAILKEIKGVAK